MTETKSDAMTLSRILVAVLSIATFNLAGYAASESSPDNELSETQLKSTNTLPGNSFKLQVFLPPVLEKSKPVWGTIYTEDGGNPPPQKVLVNNIETQTDECGFFQFNAPDADTVHIAFQNESGAKVWESTYYKTARGLLVADKSASELVDQLDELSQDSKIPVINHAPSIIEPEQTFVVVGKNFSGKLGQDEVEIDTRNADILAASPLSIVAVSNRRTNIGPIKEMRVSSKNVSSLPTEIDVTKVSIHMNAGESTVGQNIATLHNGKAENSNSAKHKIKVSVVGSTLPAVVVVAADISQKEMHFGGWRLGSQNIFISPGGMQNSFGIDADSGLNAETVSAHIISNGIFDPYSNKTTSSLLSKSVAEASESFEIVRLKKREIGLDAQGASILKQREELRKGTKPSADEDLKLDSNEKSVAARIYRVSKMLQARKIALETTGSLSFAKLIDAAADNTLSSLDSVIAGKDLGFTEARLLRAIGRKAKEERYTESQSAAYFPQYTGGPQAAMLQSYRKKWGKKGVIPPPPLAASLVPPPVPYQPDPRDIGPFITDLPLPAVHPKSASIQSKKSKSKHQASRTSPAEHGYRSKHRT